MGTKQRQKRWRLLGQRQRKEGRQPEGKRKEQERRWKEGRSQTRGEREERRLRRKDDGEKGVACLDPWATPCTGAAAEDWFVPSHSSFEVAQCDEGLEKDPNLLACEQSGKESFGFKIREDEDGSFLLRSEEAEKSLGEDEVLPLLSHDLLACGAGRKGLKGFLKKSLAGMKLGDVSQLLCSLFDEIRDSCKLKHSKVQNSGSIFPLPETLAGLKSCGVHLDGSLAWLVLAMSRSLNCYFGVEWREATGVSLAKQASVKSLATYAEEVLEWKEKFEGVRWDSLMSTRSVDYNGDEVRVARFLRWENLEGALPEEVGKISLEDVCERGTLEYIKNFEEYLVPREAQVYTRPPRVMVDEDSWEQVCSGLISCGICELMPLREIYHIDGKPLLNGLFGVSKDEFKNGWEVFRLIMNLVPVNKLCRNLGGDISTLPSWAGMAPYLLGDGEVALISSEDIRCFFYLFTIPRSWQKYLGFNKFVPSTLVPEKFKDQQCVLVSRVLPMGFLNSVSIAQHIHREVVRKGISEGPGRLGAQNEMRRDKALPSSEILYRVYLDNFDLVEKVDVRTALLVKGETSLDVIRLRQQYSSIGLPRHPKKAVQQEVVAEIQGAIVNGKSGRVTPKPGKVLKYFELVLQLVVEGFASLKQMQIACGGLVYCSMFRRPLLGMLNNVWSFMNGFAGEVPVVKKPLPDNVKLEFLRFLGALPLAQMNLRMTFSEEVTASDASEYGGGFCVSRSLTPLGFHAAHCSIRGDLPEPEDHCQVLTVGLFDGIGALRVAADALVLPMAGHLSSEVSSEASRVLESHFPDSVSIGRPKGGTP